MEAFVSSSCVKAKVIEEAIEKLIDVGIRKIELSGGTSYYDHEIMIDNLDKLRKMHNLEFLLHNYFPPPSKDFVLNLASNDNEIFKQSETHLLKCIEYSSRLESKQFGFHAGFFFNIPLNEIGKKITAKVYDNFENATEVFCNRFRKIEARANELGVKLYLENNVYSKTNHNTYGLPVPALLTNLETYQELKERIDFKLLLDVAHLKVSCQTLKKDFTTELQSLFNVSDYIHVSDNDGLHDTNNAIELKSSLYQELKQLNWSGKTVTLEIYEPLEKVKSSLENINLLLDA